MKSDLCDFNDAYLVATGKITATNPDNANYGRKLAFKNCIFFSSILRINNQLIEDAQDLDIVTPMYNLLYYSKNFRKTIGSFWNYYPEMPNSVCNGNNNVRTRIFYPIKDSENFDYKTKLVGKLPDGEDDLEDIKILVPLKDLSRFIFSLDTLMINSKIELILKWSQNCVLTEKAAREHIDAGIDPASEPAVNEIYSPTDLKFDVTNCKLCSCGYFTGRI